jgi:hypothetical protein
MSSSWAWRQPKYKNTKVTTTDGKFDSKLEYYRWCELLILEKARKITDLKRQVKFVLIDKSKYGREISYIADFTYYKGSEYIVEDTKSIATKTRVYTIKKRLMAERYGIIIKEIEQ